jgi:DNA-binding IclR family transcriptional regulator
MKLLSLEHAYIKNLPFLKKAKPFMRSLRNKTQESVYLSVLHKDSVVYIHSEETKRYVLVNSRIGKRYPAKTTASGKAMINAKNKKDFFIEEDFEKTEPEVAEIASVIRDDTGNPIAAISIVVPSKRLEKENIKEIKENLIKTARDISQIL